MSITRCLRFRCSDHAAIESGLAAIRSEQKLPETFAPEVAAAAAEAVARPRLPALDRRDIPLLTLDPPGAMDLDQALHIERLGSGYRVYYAIADVAAFVTPGDAVDREARRRGETLYGAETKIPLHPPVLSEGAASLLPGAERPALLWTLDLDASGENVAIDVRRARVASRARLDYAGLQARFDAGTIEPAWALLREVGELRRGREIARGGVSLPLPEQEASIEDGRWRLAYRARLAVEDWNEQLSLLTGMAAARLMLDAGIGLLRTLPVPAPAEIARLRVTARTLGIAWPEGLDYPGFIRALDPTRDRHVAMLTACTTVLRGAAYVAFDGAPPQAPLHSALAAPYSHATAPLRRLVDRFTGEACVAIAAGRAVPDWVREALPELPVTMQTSGYRAGQFERSVLDLAEATVLAARVGEAFEGAIVEVAAAHPERGKVMLREPAIESVVTAPAALALGADVRVRLVQADPARRLTRFALEAG